MNTMRKPLKVFLSGPISSRMETYKAEFADAARIVSEAGHLPLNPATLPIGIGKIANMNISLGGTSIIIVVGVALDTFRQLESQMMMRHYKGFLE